MKNKKLVYIIIAVVLSLVTIAITGFVLAEESKNKSYEELNRTAIVLEPKKDETTGNYTGEVEVLLQMDDGIRTEEQQPNEDGTIIEDAASVQSFQIGLDVSASVEKGEDISFEFNPMLSENAKNDVAGEVKLAKVTENLIEDKVEGKKGYKGKKLNIYYVGTKDLNDTNSREMISVGTLKIKIPENSNNETVLVNPIEEATIASSTGHTKTPIDVHPEEDGITFIMNKQDSEHEDDSGNTSGGNTSSGNTAGDDNTTGNETTGGNTSGDDNTTSGGSTEGDSGNGGSTGGSQNNGYSQLDEDKAKGNLANKLLEKLKTGANHSLTWIIVAIIVLTIVAIGIIKLKNNTPKKEGKHSRH